MKKAQHARLVFVTTPDLKVARRLARAALEARLAACANILPKIESHYWWQGNLERSGEQLVLFKTTRVRLPRLEALVLALHPYETPEFITTALAEGQARYLEWIEQSLAGT